MIKLELYPILLDNRESLRETSKDDSDPNDIQYMTSSETEVVNFDLVKRHYVNGFGLSEDAITSVDAIVPLEDRILFVEFKNGQVNNRNIKDKARDSLLVFLEIIGENSFFSQQYRFYCGLQSRKESFTKASSKRAVARNSIKSFYS